MAVESSADDFNKWLNKKLETFEIEDEVMASYISSIVTTDEKEDDKKDMLSDIFQDLVQGVNVDALCQEILEKWSLTCSNNALDNQAEEQKLDLSSRVSLIVEKSVQPVQKSANRSAEEEKLREAILSRCTYVSSEEDDYGGSDCEGAAASSMTPQNQNSESVAQAEKEKREKMKQDSEKKKVQDKVNREKQKHKQEERREKERKRTQKQERRR